MKQIAETVNEFELYATSEKSSIIDVSLGLKKPIEKILRML